MAPIVVAPPSNATEITSTNWGTLRGIDSAGGF
jgi:hypothetical protein